MYGRKHTVVARALMSKAKAGIPKTQSHRAAISAALLGRKKTEAHRKAMLGRVPWNKGLVLKKQGEESASESASVSD